MCFVKKGILRNFAKFTKKHLCLRPAPVPEACNLIKKEPLAKVFSCEFWEISQNTFFAEHHRTTASGGTKGQVLLFIQDVFKNTWLVKKKMTEISLCIVILSWYKSVKLISTYVHQLYFLLTLSSHWNSFSCF